MALFEMVEDSGDIFKRPHGAFKDGVIVHAWKIHPDAWDLVDLDYDFLRPLTAKEVAEYTGVKGAL